MKITTVELKNLAQEGMTDNPVVGQMASFSPAAVVSVSSSSLMAAAR